jgi:hypothetical protein
MTVMLETPCEECGLAPVLFLTTHARTFGHIYSMAGFKHYAQTGVCEWCAEILADFAVMGKGVQGLRPGEK